MQVARKTCCHENMDVAFFQSSRISKALIAFLRKSKSVRRHKGNVRPVQAMQTTYDGQILVEDISLIFSPALFKVFTVHRVEQGKNVRNQISYCFSEGCVKYRNWGEFVPPKNILSIGEIGLRIWDLGIFGDFSVKKSSSYCYCLLWLLLFEIYAQGPFRKYIEVSTTWVDLLQRKGQRQWPSHSPGLLWCEHSNFFPWNFQPPLLESAQMLARKGCRFESFPNRWLERRATMRKMCLFLRITQNFLDEIFPQVFFWEKPSRRHWYSLIEGVWNPEHKIFLHRIHWSSINEQVSRTHKCSYSLKHSCTRKMSEEIGKKHKSVWNVFEHSTWLRPFSREEEGGPRMFDLPWQESRNL